MLITSSIEKFTLKKILSSFSILWHWLNFKVIEVSERFKQNVYFSQQVLSWSSPVLCVNASCTLNSHLCKLKKKRRRKRRITAFHACWKYMTLMAFFWCDLQTKPDENIYVKNIHIIYVSFHKTDEYWDLGGYTQ